MDEKHLSEKGAHHVTVDSDTQLNRMTSIELMDEAALAACGYKQEFKRCVLFVVEFPHLHTPHPSRRLIAGLDKHC